MGTSTSECLIFVGCVQHWMKCVSFNPARRLPTTTTTTTTTTSTRSSALDILDGCEELLEQREETEAQERQHSAVQGAVVPNDALLEKMSYGDVLVLASNCGVKMAQVQDEASVREALRRHREVMAQSSG